MSELKWWETHDNLVQLTRWMADNGSSADDLASVVEKPWKYTPEYEYMLALQCPAGGEHEWGEHDSGDAYGPIGGGPGTVVHRWTACENCHAPMPEPPQ